MKMNNHKQAVMKSRRFIQKERTWMNPIEMLVAFMSQRKKPEPKQNVTPFVQRMRELERRLVIATGSRRGR